MDKNIRLGTPLITEEGLEIVEIVTEENDIYALVKVKVVDLPNLKFLRTDKKRREYQKDIQRRYRKKKKDRERNREKDREKRRKRRDEEENENSINKNKYPDEANSKSTDL